MAIASFCQGFYLFILIHYKNPRASPQRGLAAPSRACSSAISGHPARSPCERIFVVD